MTLFFHPFDDPLASLLLAVVFLALSGVPILLIRDPGLGQKIAAGIAVAASVLGMWASGWILPHGSSTRYLLEWSLPFGTCEVAADHLSALFLLPLFLATGCCAVYATAYRPAAEDPAARRLTFFFGLLPAAMVLVVLARNGVLFLMAWEAMALAAYFLVTTDHRDPAVQRAGTVYLLATHTGTIALFVLFALLRATTGSFAFPEPHLLPAGTAAAAVMLLAAVFGFGAKAGIMPLHIWLPGAHANAPSHVSAMMSGIMLKIGIYGLLRTVSFFAGTPDWFGWLVLLLGAVSAGTGIALAAVQRDLKRLLALSSIENVGIIFIGIGLALIGMQTDTPHLVVFGLTGAFLHILNHALFKPLLFLGSGVVIHATGTREIDRMGGVAQGLPRTALLFLLGALAICGLPPLNGFVGELFLYFAAFSETVSSPIPVLALIAPLLATVGGLAVIAFVKLFGVVFLGTPRTGSAPRHEAAGAMLAPMALLALLCLVGGIGAPLGLRLVAPAVISYGGITPPLFADVTGRVPLGAISLVSLALLLLILLVGGVYWRALCRRPRRTAPTWGCGYPAPTPRMQYTGTSFSEQVVGTLGVVVSPARNFPPAAGTFPGPARFGYRATETIIDQILTPVFVTIGRTFSLLRRLQHGQIHLYMLYIFVTLFVLMLWRH